ncbi:MAG TPA: hypothetical protein VNN10_13755 [Dehalococcoidia bacterium]|nr:hypothetical protein [Dehalococcoidia bacterium]
MTALEAAARAGDWDRLARCLLVGLLRAVEKIPGDSLSELLDLLAGDEGKGDADAG